MVQFLSQLSSKNLKPIRKIVSNYYLNVEKIHPLKQKLIENIINNLSLNENVNFILIFGSSITDNCSSYSDLDIYVDLKKEDKSIYTFLTSIYDKEIDYWNNFNVDTRLYNEILKKGVKVYERKQ